MIRKEVEKLRGLVLTPEELEEVILPIVITSKERNNKEKELDGTIKGYESKEEDFVKDFELGLSPTVSFQDDGHKCTIECEGHTYEFEFPQPVHHCIVLAGTRKKNKEEK